MTGFKSYTTQADAIAAAINAATVDTSTDNQIAATVAATGGLTAAIPGGFRGLAVSIPGAWTAADLGIVVSATSGGTYVPLFDDTGARVKITSIATGAAAVYIFPAAVWAAGVWPFFKLASLDTADGTAENQASARAVVVSFLR